MSSTSRTRITGRAVILLVVSLAALALGLGPAVSGFANPKWAPNPDDGLVDTQKAEAHEQSMERFLAHYKTWLSKQDLARDLRTYPISYLLASVREPAVTHADAVDRAELILEGQIASVTFRASLDSLIHIDVARSLKGTPPSSVDIVSLCQLAPSADWSVASIACAEAAPMLYPGDEVVLLLEPSRDGVSFAVQPWTGIYWVTGGSVRAVSGNPLQPATELMSVAQLEQALLDAQR